MAEEKIGLVLAGGGARGAYEAGVLSVLLPVLQARGQRPTIVVGSSVGAINAAYLAGSAHLDAHASAAGLIERWRDTTLNEVVRPILREQLPLLGARVVGSMLSIPGVHVSSMLDPSPVADNLEKHNDWTALRTNIDAGLLDAVAVLATAVRTERTLVFCDAAAGPPRHRSHVLDYVGTQLAVEHVQASAAIPLLFPPVQVHQPASVAGWYIDGGVRMNTPIKPALDLGADRLVVIATAGLRDRGEMPTDLTDEPPDLGDVAINMLHGKLVDPLLEDLRTLDNINALFTDRVQDRQSRRRARGKRPYREVPYIFIGPTHYGALGQLASDIYTSQYVGLGNMHSPDLAFLGRLLGARSHTHSELFSYLFFAREYIDALIAAGVNDAHARLATDCGPDTPWRLAGGYGHDGGSESRDRE